MTAQEFFKNDRFATNAGVELIEIKEGYSKARLVITAEHLNAGTRTQGRRSLTLPTWHWQQPTPTGDCLSLSSNITFLRSNGPGDVLYAEARDANTGRTTGYYQIDVTNQEGNRSPLSNPVYLEKGITSLFPYHRRHRIAVAPDTLNNALPEPKFKYMSKRMGRWFLSSDTKKVMTSFSLPFLYSTKENTKQR